MDINIFTSETFKYKKANIKFLSMDRTFVNMSIIVNKELIQIQAVLDTKVGIEIQLEDLYQNLVNQIIKYLKK